MQHNHEPAFLRRCSAFVKWHENNLALWKAFDKACQEDMAENLTSSVWNILPRMRWSPIQTTGEEFKISNGLFAFYARKWMGGDPMERGGFFRIKRMAGEDFAWTRWRCGLDTPIGIERRASWRRRPDP